MSDFRRMLIANQVRKYTGYPLVISRSVALRYLKQYQIYGNSEQDGTPTPENPVDVVSVGDKIVPAGYQELEYIESTGTQYIDTGITVNNNSRMLFDAKRSTSTEQSTYPWLGGARDYPSTTAANKKTLEFSKTRPERMYLQYGTSSERTITISGQTTDRHIYDFNKNKLYVDGGLVYTETEETFTSSATVLLCAVQYSGGGITEGALFWGSIYRFKFWQDGTNLSIDLVPAKRISDNVVGMYDTVSGQFFTNQGTGTFTAGPEVEHYQIPVVAQGKNLFDGKSNLVLYKYISSTGGILDGLHNFYCATYFPCKPNTSYVLFGVSKSDGTINYYNRLHFYDSNKTFISTSSGSGKLSVISPSNAAYVRISSNPNQDVALTQEYIESFNWYLGEGTTATSYIPYSEPITTPIYLNAPLRKIGDYADYIDYKKGQIIRNVGVKVLDGTESWSAGGTPVSRFVIEGSPTDAFFADWKKGLTEGTEPHLYCTHYPFDKYLNAGSRTISNTFNAYLQTTGTCYIRFGKTESITTLAQWTSFLAAQYAAGTPVTIYYPLATPVTESIVAPALPTMASSTTYTTETEVKPSNMIGVF